ncbi:MAG: toll/interleukin-1 receptor domain-containing protein [Phenylobacterium sp.]
MQPRTFISFASKDVKVAQTLCSALESRGIPCWISARDIQPGENFQVSIVQALRHAKIMVLVFTANSNSSEEMTKELALASQQRLIVIPLRVEDVTPGDAFTYEFATRQWIDVFADWESSIDQLCRRITRALENPQIDEEESLAPVDHEIAPEGDHVETAAEFAHVVAPAAVVAPIIDPDADEQEALDEAAFAAAGVPDGGGQDEPANENRSGMMRVVLVAAVLAIVAGLGVIAPKLLHKPQTGATVTAAVKPEGLIDAANKGPASSTTIVADPRAAVALAEAPTAEEPAAAPAPRAKRHAAKKHVETDIPY